MNFNELKEKAKALPHTSGVYIMKDVDENVIYVGKAKDLKKRVSQYFDSRPKQIKVQSMVEHVFDFDYLPTKNEAAAFALECNLIKKYKGKYNILLKDDKAFAYLKINKNEDFPTFSITRKVVSDGCQYYGPYVTNMRIGQMLEILLDAFPLRRCKKKSFSSVKRMCVHGSIGQCSAPCVGNVSKADYHKIVEEACDFLKGKTSTIIQLLQEKMEAFAKNEEFEKAIEYRDKIELVKRTKEKVLTDLPKDVNIDAFVLLSGQIPITMQIFVRNGKMVGRDVFSLENKVGTDDELLMSVIAQSYQSKEQFPDEIITNYEIGDNLEEFFRDKFGCSPKIVVPKIGYKLKLIEYYIDSAKEYASRNVDKIIEKERNTTGALQDLQTILGLSQRIWRIEGYDISNTSGTNSVASMVVFEGGESQNKKYRKFKIKTVEGPNDFASLQEALKRRFMKDDSFGTKPDLLLIDGGLGQLHAVKQQLESMGIVAHLISLAKKEELIYTTSCNDPIRLSYRDPALKLLQRIRNEAHRFAIGYHRLLRSKSMKGELKLVGVGKGKKENLIEHFKTSENLLDATVERLMEVDGIGEKLAKSIFEQLHNNI